MKKIISIVLSACLSLSIVACGNNSSNKDKKGDDIQIEEKSESTSENSEEKASHYPVKITTYNYAKEPVEITIKEEPKKVLAVYQNSIETMLSLGLEDKIVAAAGLDHEVKSQWKEAFSKINYLTEFTPDKESVIMLEPDFILSWYSIFGEKRLGDVGYWHEKGINTYMSLNSGAVPERTLENECTDILNIGKIFNVEERAQELVDEINNEVTRVADKVKGQEKKSALIIEFGKESIYVYGEKTLGGDMINKLGAELLKPEGGNIGDEDLITLNPDNIFVVYMDREDVNMAEESVKKVMDNPALASLSAIKNNNVQAIQLGEMYSSGVRTIDGINKFAKGLYPELYEK